MDTDSKTVTISNQDPQAFGVLDPFKPPLAALSSFALLSDFPPLAVLLSLAPLPLLFFALLPLQLAFEIVNTLHSLNLVILDIDDLGTKQGHGTTNIFFCAFWCELGNVQNHQIQTMRGIYGF